MLHMAPRLLMLLKLVLLLWPWDRCCTCAIQWETHRSLAHLEDCGIPG